MLVVSLECVDRRLWSKQSQLFHSAALVNHLLALGLYLTRRHESGIDLFIQFWERKQISLFPKMSS